MKGSLEKQLILTELRNILLMGLLLVVIWAALLAFIPDGWWITVINIIFLILTLIGIGYGSMQRLKFFMPTMPALFVALLSQAKIS